MNKKYVGLVVLLVLHGSVHSMQYAGRFALNGARVGCGALLVGGGFGATLLARAFLKAGLRAQADVDGNGQDFNYMFRNNIELGKIAAASCLGVATGSALLSAGALGMYGGSLLLKSKWNKAAMGKVAQLCKGLSLFNVGMITGYNAFGFISETQLANDDDRARQALIFTGLFGAVSAICLRNTWRLFLSGK